MSGNPRGIDAVLFDKDGTLFDFQASWGGFTARLIRQLAPGDPAAQARLAARLDFDLGAARYRPTSFAIGGTMDELAGALHAELPGWTASALSTYLARETAAAPQVEAVPLAGFLADLRGRGLALGVATNDGEAPARAHLAAAGVEAAFDFIAGYDSGHGGKPAPGQLLAFAGAVGVAPGRCAMVGDSLHDLIAAGAAGMVPVGVLTGPAAAEDLAGHAAVVLNSIADLPAWLGESA